MNLLFTLDLNDYKGTEDIVYRPSSRGIIWKGDELALVHSRKYGYYKFPGGGIDGDEDRLQALIREVREEVGLDVIPGSVEEYGKARRIEKGKWDYIFDQDNYYYTCRVTGRVFPQELGNYESKAKFELQYVDPKIAVKENENFLAGNGKRKVAI